MKFATIAEDDTARASLFCALFEEERRPLSIRFIEEAGPTMSSAPRMAREHGYRVPTRVLEPSPYLEIGDGGRAF